MIFRLLCHVDTVGGVKGSSGSVIKQLESRTGCKIQVEDPLPNCHERVINIIGDSNIYRRINISYQSSEEGDIFEVSRAQEGLIRVFERVLEIEGSGIGVIGCRLLANSGQISALIGKGGTVVDGIRKNTGAKIKVLKNEQLPDCAVRGEELIQIMGRVSAVKKALVSVAWRLQGLPAHVTSKGMFHEQSADFPLDTKSLGPPLPRKATDHSLVVHSLSLDVDRVMNLDADSAQRRVVFRLLCSNAIAGGVIGRGANIIKALEKETGASISFSTPIAGSKERVAIISSLESQDPLYSPAQVATIRMFERSVEVIHELGGIQGAEKDGSVSARLLVGPREVKCLLDERGRVSSDICSAAGIELQLLGAEHALICAESDRVVQIVGGLDDVKSALSQITGRLRKTFFSSLVSEGALPENHSCSSRHEMGTSMPSQFDHLPNFSSLDQMDHLGFVPNLGGPHTLLQSKDKLNGKPAKESTGGWKSCHGGLDGGRVNENGLAKKTMVITVSEQKLRSVFGENGSNLARLEEISRAEVILQNPGPGECDGKVIITGAPEQIEIANSVVQAFILI